MYATAHLALGMIIGKITGDYPTAISTSVFLDVDHVFEYAKHGKLKSFKSFLHSTKDSVDSSRSYFHSIFFLILGSGLMYLIFGDSIALVFLMSVLGHYLLDLLDTSGFYPFFPLRGVHLQGFIKYYSKAELFLTIFLFGVFFLVS